RSIISLRSRSSSTANRAGTLASNGNCCSSRVHSAWMVWTFRPPGVSSAHANSARARILKSALGCATPASRSAPACCGPRAGLGAALLPFLDPQPAGRGPFLDAGEIVIGAVSVRPHRQIERGIGLAFVLEAADQRFELP